MKTIETIITGEKGSIILAAMVILILLTLIGMAATRTSTIEIDIAANDKFHKQALFESDSGVSWGIATLRQGDENEDIGHVFSGPAEDGPFVVTNRGQIFFNCPSGATCIEIQSDSAGNAGNVSIIAGIELPTPIEGALEDTGEECTY
jgi:Tfp pilus assembly protein PilX